MGGPVQVTPDKPHCHPSQMDSKLHFLRGHQGAGPKLPTREDSGLTSLAHVHCGHSLLATEHTALKAFLSFAHLKVMGPQGALSMEMIRLDGYHAQNQDSKAFVPSLWPISDVITHLDPHLESSAMCSLCSNMVRCGGECQ